MKRFATLCLLLGLTITAYGQIVGSLPFNLQNNTTADATQVMSNFNTILNGVNLNAAKNGVNTDITQLSALTTALTRAQGGTSTYVGTAASTGAANAQVVAATAPTFSLATNTIVQFVPGFTNTGATTLTVGATSAINVYRSAGGVLTPLVGGEIVSGSTAMAVYDGTQYVLIIDQTAAVPPTAVFWTAASSGAAPAGYILLQGQAISRTTYARLFALLGTTYGVGDGSTTFNVPDVQGRSIFSNDNGAGRISGCGSSGAVASVCGSQTIAQSNLPNVNFVISASQWTPTISMGGSYFVGTATANITPSGVTTVPINPVTPTASSNANPQMLAASGGSGTGFYPPAIVLTAIMKY